MIGHNYTMVWARHNKNNGLLWGYCSLNQPVIHSVEEIWIDSWRLIIWFWAEDFNQAQESDKIVSQALHSILKASSIVRYSFNHFLCSSLRNLLSGAQ